MKGVIFNVFEEVIVEQFGATMWDDLLDATELDGAYTSLGSYPDNDIVALIGASAAKLSKSPQDMLRWFGRNAIPVLALRYPVFFEAPRTTRNFLLSVNSIIHPEVRKLYSGAGCPHFQFKERPGLLVIGYDSPRRMCHLAEGFVAGVADHYGDNVTVSQIRCMHQGASSCELTVEWAS